jgi:hypothetical protein
MPFKLFVFPPDSNKATVVATHDTGGWVLPAVPGTHWSGRAGLVVNVPDGTPNVNGVEIHIDQPGLDRESQRGILLINTGGLPWPFDTRQEAAFAADDFHMNVTKVCPACPPCPPPCPPIPPGGKTPLEIINGVYNTGQFNLATYDGCGKFTEACTTALHTLDSEFWGHLQKFPPQNHYPDQPYVPGGKVHALDALQLLRDTPTTKAGIYDIVFSSVSPEAHPTFNPAGSVNPPLWYYPA